MSSPPDRITRDLQRDVHCLFGLPVDNLTIAQTKALLRERCTQEGNTVLATINVNWVAQSLREPAFREAIINSDLVVLDGKPLLWLAQLLGCPMRETVPGSTLIQELLEEPSEQPLTIFLFGGEGDVADRAMLRINERKNGGLRAVGALNPGFGTVEEMSTDAIIDAINTTCPDFLLVALGAKKGTQWIEYNRDRLNAKVISHLGATINFLAGTIKRAPYILQRFGLEWVWRIVQEPKLFSRYSSDGFRILKVLVDSFPLWLKYQVWRRCFSKELRAVSAQIEERRGTTILTFGFYSQANHDSTLRELVCRAALADKDISLDLYSTKYVDSACSGLLLLLKKHQKRKKKNLTLNNMQRRVKQIFRLFGVRNASARVEE